MNTELNANVAEVSEFDVIDQTSIAPVNENTALTEESAANEPEIVAESAPKMTVSAAKSILAKHSAHREQVIQAIEASRATLAVLFSGDELETLVAKSLAGRGLTGDPNVDAFSENAPVSKAEYDAALLAVNAESIPGQVAELVKAINSSPNGAAAIEWYTNAVEQVRKITGTINVVFTMTNAGLVANVKGKRAANATSGEPVTRHGATSMIVPGEYVAPKPPFGAVVRLIVRDDGQCILTISKTINGNEVADRTEWKNGSGEMSLNQHANSLFARFKRQVDPDGRSAGSYSVTGGERAVFQNTVQWAA